MAKLSPSDAASAANSSRSSSTRRRAGSQTAPSRWRTAFGVFAIILSRPNSAKLAKPCCRAFSALSCRVSAMISRLSLVPPFAPRAIQALKATSRRSRRAEKLRPPLQILLTEQQHVAGFIGQFVLGELRRERREPLGNLGRSFASRLVQPCAGAHEGPVRLLQQPHLLGAQTQAVALLIE